MERGAGVAHDGRAAASPRLLSREPGWRLRRRHPTRSVPPRPGSTRPSCCSGGARVTATSTRTRAPELTSFSGRLAADTAFGLAGVTRDDIDVAGVSDHFTISVITELEDAGFCAKGEGGAFVDDGGIALDGRLPTNTHGGYLSGTHAASCALFTLIELVEQLRGEAGPRQVDGAELAFHCGVGGVSQAHYAAVLGTRRDVAVRGVPARHHAARRAVLGRAAPPRARRAAVRRLRAAAVRAQRAVPQLRLAVGNLDAGQRRRDRVHVLDRPPRADTRVPGRRALRDRVRRARGRTAHADPPGRRRTRTRSRSACRSRSCSTTSTTTSPCTASGPKADRRGKLADEARTSRPRCSP